MVITQGNCVMFRVSSPKAWRVFLVGDFNDWGAAPLPMVRVGDGSWVAAVRLPAGIHRFAYVADGRRQSDQAGSGVGPGTDGPGDLVKVCMGVA